MFRRTLGLSSLLIAFAFAANATNLTVDCTGAPATFTSINAAINTLDYSGPHVVSVIGTCNENVNVRSRDRITIEGSATTPSGIHAAAGVAVNVQQSHSIVLHRLTISGGTRGVFAHAQSELTLDAVTIDGSFNGLTAFDESFVTVGGNAATQAVTVQNGTNGATIDNSSLTSNGYFTIQNNSGIGLTAEHARIVMSGQRPGPIGGMNVIHANGGNGVFTLGGSNVDFNGKNSIDGNTLNGVLAYQNSVVELSGSGAGFGTTVENNVRGGIAAIFNATIHTTGATIQNNGTAGDPLSSGITSAQNSSALIDSTTVTGTSGIGMIVEAGGMLRLRASTISGSTGDPIVIRTGGILELQTDNTLSGSGKNVVTCDGTAILYGDGANVATDCKKAP